MPSPRIRITWQSTPPPSDPLDESRLAAALEGFLEALGHGGRGVSVLLADDATLHGLNREHRGHDAPTDILSWSYLEDPPAAAPDGAEAIPGDAVPHPEATPGGAEGETGFEPGAEPLGDLALSLDRARHQAAENGWDLVTEVLRLLAHGCAHLAGYDHQTEDGERHMRAVEIALLEGQGLTGIYPGEG